MSSAEYSCKLFKPIFAYRQTVCTLIRLLLEEQSDLGPHCLQKRILESQVDDIADDNCCDWPPSSFHTDCSKVVPLLQFFFVHRWFQMWRCLVIVCSSCLIFLVLQESYASWLWHFLGIRTYIFDTWSIFHQKISWLTVCVPAYQTPSIKESKFFPLSLTLVMLNKLRCHTHF